MDYEKQFGSQNSHFSGSQGLPCTLCPEKSFKDNNRLKIHVNNNIISIINQWRLVQEGQMGNAPPKQIVK
jgi:hypothetical protein